MAMLTLCRDEYWLQEAYKVAASSPHPDTMVGAIIVGFDDVRGYACNTIPNAALNKT